MAAIFETTVGTERAKIYLISARLNPLLRRSQTVVENRNTRQMPDIFLQDPKGVGMRFKPENLCLRELAMKINNGSTDIAADVENGFRSEARRHIVLCL